MKQREFKLVILHDEVFHGEKELLFWSWVTVMWVSINPSTQLPIENNIVKTEINTWIDFKFDNKYFESLSDNISVLPFLKQSFEEIKTIIFSIEKEL